ncbi:DMT family transporter [Microbacterium sp. NPDC091662]|uniref:DMT family transporter n=1 Tax=Microbacterium sp. NPDC091662 TaxID=3364211 RepID=UPI00381D96F9
MPWIVLLISAVLEAVWATALGLSQGFSRPSPTIVFLIALALSMIGLGWAMKHIPIGTAYAVWVGLGAVLTVTWAMLTGAEVFSAGKAIFIGGIVAAVIGLKLVKSPRVIANPVTDTPPDASSLQREPLE